MEREQEKLSFIGAKRLRNIGSAVKSVQRMTSSGGKTQQQAMGIARTSQKRLEQLNRELLSKSPAKLNIVGRTKKRRRLSKTQELMDKLEKTKSRARPVKAITTSAVKKEKPRFTKKQLVGGGLLLGGGVLGGSVVGSKRKGTSSQYNEYY